MTVYGGFDPGTFQAWALNLFNTIFVSPGIARGFQVTPTSPVGMSVQATLDSVAQDGVVFLPNGAFLRIDAVTQFTITSNSSGTTRTDALVAQVDPTNAANLSLAIQANWATSFTGTANQFVIALISVANGAVSISSGNITMNSAVAKVAGAGGSNAISATDGISMTAADNSASSTFTLALSNLGAGVGRAVLIQATDTSSIGHLFTFGMDSTFTAPSGLRSPTWYLDPTAINSETPNSVYLTATSSASGAGVLDIHHHNPTGGWVYLDMKSGSGTVDAYGRYSTALAALNASNSYTINGHVVTVGQTAPTVVNKYDVFLRTISF